MINAIGNFIGKISGETAAMLASAFASRVEADGGVVEAQSCLTDRIQSLKANGLWSKASAAWLPHGYAEGKLYAAKGGPEADLTISRNGTRTRKGPTYVEQVPYNFIQYSQDLTQANWSKGTGITVEADVSTGHISGVTASRVSGFDSGAGDRIFQQCSEANADGTYTGSIWLKGEGSNIGKIVKVVLKRGTSGTFTASDTLHTLTADWVKISLTLTLLPDNVDISLILSADVTPASEVLVSGAQVVSGSEEREYFPTTDRFNVPALDYTNDTCPALSLEPARTNSCRESEALGITPWALTDVTVTSNAIEGPNGLSTADLVTNSAGSTSELAQNIGITANAVHTFSGYFKYSSNQFIQIRFCHSTLINDAVVAWFNPLTGSVLLTQNSGTGTGVTASSEAVLDENGNETGWYRFILTGAINGGYTTGRIFIRCTNTTNSSTSPGQAYYATGLQLEAGSYATSYIPTTTATVTRLADTVNPLTNVAHLIGQTEGTLYWEGSVFADGNQCILLQIEADADNNIFLLKDQTSNGLKGRITVNGVNQVNLGGSAFVTGETAKVAFTYKANDCHLYMNGVKVGGADLSNLIPACTTIRRNSNAGTIPFNGYDKCLLVLPVALTEAEAITATTL